MLIPTLQVRDIPEAIAFLTEVLDFRLGSSLSFYAVLLRGDDELHVALVQGGSRRGSGVAIVLCDDVDALFAVFKARGLNVPNRPESPVHERPIDQTWGTREFYVDDPSGNTLVFQQR